MAGSGLKKVGPVPGARITDQQVCLYMKIRKNKSQGLAAAKAGFSQRSARRIDSAVTLLQRVAKGARFAQRERPVVQSAGLHGKEREDFVERADLVVPPTADPHGGWCGGWGLDIPGYPIRLHLLRLSGNDVPRT
jgi:hypothetical protein